MIVPDSMSILVSLLKMLRYVSSPSLSEVGEESVAGCLSPESACSGYFAIVP